jgi:hypothetical protein
MYSWLPRFRRPSLADPARRMLGADGGRQIAAAKAGLELFLHERAEIIDRTVLANGIVLHGEQLGQAAGRDPMPARRREDGL